MFQGGGSDSYSRNKEHAYGVATGGCVPGAGSAPGALGCGVFGFLSFFPLDNCILRGKGG